MDDKRFIRIKKKLEQPQDGPTKLSLSHSQLGNQAIMQFLLHSPIAPHQALGRNKQFHRDENFNRLPTNTGLEQLLRLYVVRDFTMRKSSNQKRPKLNLATPNEKTQSEKTRTSQMPPWAFDEPMNPNENWLGGLWSTESPRQRSADKRSVEGRFMQRGNQSAMSQRHAHTAPDKLQTGKDSLSINGQFAHRRFAIQQPNQEVADPVFKAIKQSWTHLTRNAHLSDTDALSTYLKVFHNRTEKQAEDRANSANISTPQQQHIESDIVQFLNTWPKTGVLNLSENAQNLSASFDEQALERQLTAGNEGAVHSTAGQEEQTGQASPPYLSYLYGYREAMRGNDFNHWPTEGVDTDWYERGWNETKRSLENSGFIHGMVTGAVHPNNFFLRKYAVGKQLKVETERMKQDKPLRSDASKMFRKIPAQMSPSQQKDISIILTATIIQSLSRHST